MREKVYSRDRREVSLCTRLVGTSTQLTESPRSYLARWPRLGGIKLQLRIQGEYADSSLHFQRSEGSILNLFRRFSVAVNYDLFQGEVFFVEFSQCCCFGFFPPNVAAQSERTDTKEQHKKKNVRRLRGRIILFHIPTNIFVHHARSGWRSPDATKKLNGCWKESAARISSTFCP